MFAKQLQSVVAVLVLSTTANSASVPLPRRAAAAKGWTSKALHGISALNQQWYNPDNGLWQDYWWNSGNMLTIIADYALMKPREGAFLQLEEQIETTFQNAQKTNVMVAKTMGADHKVTTDTCFRGAKCDPAKFGKQPKQLSAQGFGGFINEFYDDEGWWALGLIRSYDVTSDRKYLDAAVNIFEDMKGGGGTPCGGGIYWNKDRKYVNAIANELYLSVAAELASRIPGNKDYLRIAKSQWDWFMGSGMINSDNLINDGLDNCKNNGFQTWTYNQGVILGGAAELYKITKDRKYIDKAKDIAKATIKAMGNSNGVLEETDKCELRPGNCGTDGQQFKGVFIRNLRYLWQVAPDRQFKEFILSNAESIWYNDRLKKNFVNNLGVAWTGPYLDNNAIAHSSALDAVVAAVAVSN